EALWIVQIVYDSRMGEMASSDSGPLLTLQGQSVGPSLSAGQDTINQFRQKLQGDDRFGKVFSCSTPSIEAADPAASSGRRPNGQETQDLKTRFVLTCRGKVR